MFIKIKSQGRRDYVWINTDHIVTIEETEEGWDLAMAPGGHWGKCLVTRKDHPHFETFLEENRPHLLVIRPEGSHYE